MRSFERDSNVSLYALVVDVAFTIDSKEFASLLMSKEIQRN